MKKIRFPLLILATMLSCTFLTAQKVVVADKFFDEYAYPRASELYEEVVKRGDSSEHVLTRLGDSYYNNAVSDKAAFWFGEAIKKYPDIHPEYIYKYILTLRSINQYDKAAVWETKFNILKDIDDRIKDLEIADNNSVVINLDSTYVKLSNLELNSFYSEFGGFIHKNKMYFSSTRDFKTKQKKVKRFYKWNEEPFLDLFQANISKDSLSGKVSEIIPVQGINSEFHEAGLTITNDGQTMYFTRDNRKKNNDQITFNTQGTSHLKIYKTTLTNGKWTNITELPFNGEDFSTGHPALSPDNKKLYFVSDRFGSRGKTDIYVVDILSDNSYSEPKNLGNSVNSLGREMFPFINKDNVLFFTSDGHKNFGLLDIFKSDYLNNPNAAKPINLGPPFNSRSDDFAYFENIDGNGFISSNRSGGKGNDDIYAFEYITEKLPCYQTITGIVKDSITYKVIPNATINIIDSSGKVANSTQSNTQGVYNITADCDTDYKIQGTKDNYDQVLKPLSTDFTRKKINTVNLNLTPLIQGDQIVINPIFFDLNKWNIRPDAAFELESIVTVLKNNPDMIIKIEGHTDSRGSYAYNRRLSDRRAKATRDYILSRNIDPIRIESAVGFGESQLLNDCKNGVKCSEEKHQENRRSYFFILNQNN